MAKFWKYLKAAFSFQPSRVLPPLSWGFLALAALGFFNILFLFAGLGLGACYLFLLSTSDRFQRYVEGKELLSQREGLKGKLQDVVTQLPDAARARYRKLEATCSMIVENAQKDSASGSLVQVDVSGINGSLAHLAWIYLRLLKAYYTLQNVMGDLAADAHRQLEGRIAALEKELAEKTLTAEVRTSLTAQLDIMKRRLEGQIQAGDKMQYVEAELGRIEEQVELVREQTALATDPSIVASRVDSISETLQGTNNWIKEQQKMFGGLDDDLQEPPVNLTPQSKEETQ
jgi:hypothetical protein